MAELATNDTVAVVDANYAPPSTNFGGPTAPHPILSVGDAIGLANPATGTSATVTVIGILKEAFVPGVWVSPARAQALGYVDVRALFLTTAPDVDTTHAPQLANAAFFQYGLVLFDFASLLGQSIAGTEGFIGL